MEVRQLAPGLWRWTAAHPDWTPAEGGEEGWEPDVGCVYCEAEEGIVLVDPLVPTEPDERERFWRALDGDVRRVGSAPAVLLTISWHTRSAREVAARYAGARVLACAAAREEMEARTDVGGWFQPGDPLPGGIEAYGTPHRHEVVFWLPSHAALVPGDVLLGDGAGGVRLLPDSWLGDVSRNDLLASLRPLLELPVERVLVSHGEPVLEGAREALARALAA